MTVLRLRRTGSDGFSLLETMVALAVIGLIVSAAGTLTGLLGVVDDRSKRTLAGIETVLAAERVLRAVVDGAVPDARGDEEADRRATANRLPLLSRGPEALASDRPRRVALEVTSAGNRTGLDLVWTDPESGAPDRRSIIDGVDRVSFAYLGAAGPAVWRDRWDVPSVLPAGVMVRIDAPHIGGPLEIVLRTGATLPAACIALPHEPACLREQDR